MPADGVIDAKIVILQQISETPGIRHRELLRYAIAYRVS